MACVYGICRGINLSAILVRVLLFLSLSAAAWSSFLLRGIVDL